MTKRYKLPKLALDFIGYLITSMIIACFSFNFLYFTSICLAETIIEEGYLGTPIVLDQHFLSWLELICILASLVIFFAFFLLFIAQKVSYILSITKAIQILKGGDLTFRIEIRGDDELAELADTINSFSIALQNHIQNEEILKKEKEELIRSLSHDIRTPLTAIISYTDFIKNKKYNNNNIKLENYIDVIQSKAHQIQELTDLLLNTDVKQTEFFEEPLLEGKLMFEQFLSELGGSLEDAGFEIDIDKLGLVEFTTQFNVQAIARIFDNLYTNIIKYADRQEKIGFKIFLTDGILIMLQTNIINNKKISSTESHGIGLKNIKQIASNYNGEMHVISTHNTYKIEIKLPV